MRITCSGRMLLSFFFFSSCLLRNLIFVIIVFFLRLSHMLIVIFFLQTGWWSRQVDRLIVVVRGWAKACWLNPNAIVASPSGNAMVFMFQHLLTTSSFCTALLFAQVDCFFWAYGDCYFLMMATALHRGKLLFLFFFFFCSHLFSCYFFTLINGGATTRSHPSRVDCFLFFYEAMRPMAAQDTTRDRESPATGESRPRPCSKL